MKFLNPEPSSICNLWRSLCTCWTPLLNIHCIQNHFAYFGCVLFSSKIYSLHICQLPLHSMIWLDWLDTTSRCRHIALCVICTWTL
jgi:hypothetical protein